MSRLDSVRQARQPFARLSRRLIAGTLERFLPEDGLIVEIGMGDGQLRDRLPETLFDRVIHTEPNAAVSRPYRRQHRQANVLRAAAERLPFEPASVSAVIGLCVLDVVADGPAVALELARVLRPGGRLIHWLDMTTIPDTLIDSLWSTGLVPLPNWFGDPSAADWPEDLCLVHGEQLALVVSSLRQAGSPAARPLGQYLAAFSSAPVTPGAPTRELIQLQESPNLRRALKGAFRMAFELATPDVRARMASFQVHPFSSAQQLEIKLRSWFGQQAGFRVELSELERAWETDQLQGPELVYRSCLIGEQRHLAVVPDARLCAEASSASGETLLELGLFSFVATKLGE